MTRAPPIPRGAQTEAMYTALILYASAAIALSFLCSLWEAVLLSITPSYAQIRMREGTSTGRQLEAFKKNIDRPLAAILTLNTIAHTAGAIGVGQQATMIWSDAHPLITALFVPVVTTLAILILSEIVPKTIGATQWERLAPFTVHSLAFVTAALAPLIWMTQLVTRLFKGDESKSVFSRSDFLAMAEIGVEEGHLKESETEMLKNLLKFDTIRTKDVMTPRTVVKTASEEETIREFYDRNRELRFSRIPLHEKDNTDRITGYMLKDALLDRLVKGRGDDLVLTLKRDILIVHESFPILKLFNRFIEKREHIALVVDDFGGMGGIISMEDVIETLLGMEIVDEYDNIEDMQALARRNWERRATLLGLLQEEQTSSDGGE